MTSSTYAATSTDEARTVADTIRAQLGVFGLGVVGARNLGFAHDQRGALSFQATLHFTGQTRARKMRVTITLTGADLYDVTVTRPDCTEYEYETGVFAEDLTALMYRLDADGIPAGGVTRPW